jgi:hypothetical protein
MIRIISHGVSNEKKSSLSFYRIPFYSPISSFISPLHLSDCFGCGLFLVMNVYFFIVAFFNINIKV